MVDRARTANVNEAELESLYCAIAPRLRRYLGRLCSDAEDLVQETFFRYLRAGYTATGEERTKLLFTIATNLARNRWSRRREQTPMDAATPAPADDPIARLDLIAALDKLAPRERKHAPPGEDARREQTGMSALRDKLRGDENDCWVSATARCHSLIRAVHRRYHHRA
jgi:hypothetical protein